MRFVNATRFFSAAGLVFSLFVFFTGGEVLCVSSGCEIFAGFKLFGVSLWLFAAAYFALSLALSVLAPAALKVLGAAAVLLDAVLLSVMLFVAPCVNCLIVGGLIFLTFVSAFGLMATIRTKPAAALALLWALLFAVNALSAVRESLPPYAIAGDADAPVKVYFSPSCEACAGAVEKLGGRADVAFFPVIEKDGDLAFVAALEEALAKGASLPEAFAERKAAGTAQPEPQVPALLRLALWRNAAHLAACRAKVLPHIEFAGLPEALSEPRQPTFDPARDFFKPSSSCVRGQDGQCN